MQQLRGAALVLAVAGLGCGSETGTAGPDCRALIEAARAAQACDPQLETLANAVAQAPDEQRCRAAARSLLAEPTPRASTVRSLWTPAAPDGTDPLRAAETEALRTLPHPARVVVTPDVPKAPGIPATTATVEGIPLEADGAEWIHARVAPGARTLTLQHAGRQASYCLELRPCATLGLTAHGAKLARHADVASGRCATRTPE